MTDNTLEGIKLKSRIAGMSNDKYVWPENSFYNAKNIDPRHMSKWVTLANKETSQLAISTVSGDVVSCFFEKFAVTKTGYIIDLSSNRIVYKFKSASTFDFELYNVFKLGNYFYFVGTKNFARLDTDFSSTNIVSNPDASVSGSWNIGTGWTFNNPWFTHSNGGGTSALRPFTSTSIVSSRYYRFVVTHTGCTTGTCTINFKSTGSGNVPISWATMTSSNNGMNTFFGTSPSDAVSEINLIPSNDFNGKITGIEIYAITTFTESYMTGADNASTVRPVLNYYGDVFVWQWNKIIKVDALTSGSLWSDNDVLIFDSNETVISFHKIQDQIVVVTNKQNYLWDGVADAPLRSFDWPNQTISQTANKWDEFLVISKALNENMMWLSNWAGKVPLFRDETNTWDRRIQFLSASTSNINATTQNLAAEFWLLTYILGIDCVYTFWHHYPGFPDALVKTLSVAGTPTAIWVYNNLLYVAVRTGSTNTIYSFPYSTSWSFASSWYVDDVFYGSELDLLKSFVAYRIGYYLPNSNCWLRFYSAIDNETDRFTFITWALSQAPAVWDTYSHNSSTYTVKKVDVYGSVNIISTQRTTGTNSPSATTGTLTRVSGNGDTSISFTDYHNMRYVGKIVWDTNETWRRDIFYNDFNENFYEMIWRTELIWNNTTTPRVMTETLVANWIRNEYAK